MSTSEYTTFVQTYPQFNNNAYNNEMEKIYNFLMENKIFMTSSIIDHQRPPLEGVVLRLEKEFSKTFLKVKKSPVFFQFKQCIGKAIKHILEEDGFLPYKRCDLRKSLTIFFTKSSLYKKI